MGMINLFSLILASCFRKQTHSFNTDLTIHYGHFTNSSIFLDTLSSTVIKCKLNNNNSETLVAIWSRNLLKYVIMHWPQLAGDFYQNHYYFIRAIKALTDDLCRAHTAVSALTVLKCLRLKYLTGVISYGHRRQAM